MKKIVTFGEALMRLSPPNYQRFLQARNFDINYGGAEANVALALANLGYDSYYVTKVPDNALGHAAINSIRQFGVNTNYVVYGGDKLGLYFLETGSSVRASNVIYDRKNSAISSAKSEEFDWDEIFTGKDMFLVTGITPAISDKLAQITEEALKKAKEKNLEIVIDVNYRAKMWDLKKANQVMTKLLPYADIVIGFTPDILLEIDQNLDPDEHVNLLKRMVETYDLKIAASTFRTSHSANHNSLKAKLYDGKKLYTSKEYEFDIVDRVGGGDSFTTGLISGIMDEKPIQEALEFATATSVWKHTIPGDANIVIKEEIENLAKGGSTLVQR
ncbi:sugar kinase [Anaerococcus sp. Marseille-Q7828]|uniref:sugar kinase n=1 Tax=Anaerococcus sp. Marseille-Q7828 TaxID=3036300 RepID=UPI0024AC8E6F|nr:sugar kinase [Anaerococcus sp. Marseille-Q7828]